MKKLMIVVASLLVLTAIFMTFMSPDRYGTHSDNRPCGANPEKRYHYTVTGYFLFADANPRENTQIGTCPYQYYVAGTYALELWVAAIVIYLLSVRKSRSKQ